MPDKESSHHQRPSRIKDVSGRTMTQFDPKDFSKRGQAGRIKDARGRRVTQLDPVVMYLLRQHDVIEADVLKEIVQEEGVRIRITRSERIALIVLIVAVLCILSSVAIDVLTGSIRYETLRKTVTLVTSCVVLLGIWYAFKAVRFERIAKAILKHLRCPHCGYDLRMLPTDPADGATVCPECGCAWRLADKGATSTTASTDGES